jgi:CxxC motif-containing protein (DUF1111 family)
VNVFVRLRQRHLSLSSIAVLSLSPNGDETMMKRPELSALLLIGLIAPTGALAAQQPSHSAGMPNASDPGVRGGPAGAGGPLPGLEAAELAFYYAAQKVFLEVDSVSGTIPGETGVGLGPRFNLNSCAGCHAQPAVGGTSPATNPQVAVATLDGARNVVPSFITANGPVREARFVANSDGSPDGGVHDLFVVTGRTDAPGCNIAQPNFAAQLAQNNVIFRIPTPLFGLGLVENVPDSVLEANLAQNPTLKASLGITGRFNRSANDGTITRFGWKAQNKSLLMFSGEAYNVELGVTNELFPNERETNLNCQFNTTPEDRSNMAANSNAASAVSAYSSDVVNFAAFARLSAPPVPAALTAASQQGSQVFLTVGCQVCHVVTQTTGKSAYTGQSNRSFQPFSDFALHNMGLGLADGISQGIASGQEFRTAPLWGLGQRIFFLHDGRTNDLMSAIRNHASQGSEANVVIGNFNRLSAADMQALLIYLRSL